MTSPPTEVFFRPDTSAPTEGLFHPVSRFNYEKPREISFFCNKLISNFNVFNDIKIILHYSVYLRTLGEKVRISDEAERVQSVSYSRVR